MSYEIVVSINAQRSSSTTNMELKTKKQNKTSLLQLIKCTGESKAVRCEQTVAHLSGMPDKPNRFSELRKNWRKFYGIVCVLTSLKHFAVMTHAHGKMNGNRIPSGLQPSDIQFPRSVQFFFVLIFSLLLLAYFDWSDDDWVFLRVHLCMAA